MRSGAVGVEEADLLVETPVETARGVAAQALAFRRFCDVVEVVDLRLLLTSHVLEVLAASLFDRWALWSCCRDRTGVSLQEVVLVVHSLRRKQSLGRLLSKKVRNMNWLQFSSEAHSAWHSSSDGRLNTAPTMLETGSREQRSPLWKRSHWLASDPPEEMLSRRKRVSCLTNMARLLSGSDCIICKVLSSKGQTDTLYEIQITCQLPHTPAPVPYVDHFNVCFQ